MRRSDLCRALTRLVTNPDFLCVLAIAAATVVFLGPALRPGYTLLPLALEGGIAPWNKQVFLPNSNLLISDPFYFDYPYRHLIAQSLRQGTFLLWTPHVFSGHPIMGDVLAQPFYPPNVIGAFLPTFARAWVFLIWGHMMLTGLLMYGYLRQMVLRPVSALLGAVAWMFNATIVVWLEEPAFLSTIAWLPGIFWLLDIGKQRRLWRAVAGAGVMFGLLLLAGETQFAIGAAWLIGAWGVFYAVVESLTRRRVILWPTVAALVAGLIGIGVGMIQLAPAFEFVQLSHRASSVTLLSLTSPQAGWPWRNVITLWLPDFYGNPVRYPWWGRSNFAEMSVYFGLWPFILSLCTLIWCKRLDGRFWGGMVLVVLLVVLGTPVAYLLRWVPGTAYVPLTRWLCLIPFAGAIASAFALDAAQEQLSTHPGRIWLTLAGVAALMIAASAITIHSQREQVIAHSASLWRQAANLVGLLLVGLLGWIVARRRLVWGMALLVLVSFADLAAWGMPFNPVTPLSILYPDNPVTDWLRQDAGLYRVLPLQSDRVVFGPNVLSMFGFQEAGGYSSQVVRRYRDLAKAISDRVEVWWMAPNINMLVHSEFSPLFSMLNVKYVLSSHQRAEQVTVEVAPDGCTSNIPLRSGEVLTQVFHVANPGLNRLDVLFSPQHHPGRASLRFWLWRERAGGELVADIPFETMSISPEGLAVFFFQPVADSSGETFVWGVEAVDVGGQSDLALCQTSDRQALSFGAYATQFRYVDMIQGVWIYDNPNVLPRAYVSHHIEAVTDEEALARIRNREFDPWHSVLVPPLLSSELQALTETPALSRLSPATVVEYSPHRVVLTVQLADPGILVLSDTWYPGWYATIDGQATEVLRVNYALRGVYVPGGDHRVEFLFRPPSLHLGAAISCVTLIATVLIVWLDEAWS